MQQLVVIQSYRGVDASHTFVDFRITKDMQRDLDLKTNDSRLSLQLGPLTNFFRTSLQ